MNMYRTGLAAAAMVFSSSAAYAVPTVSFDYTTPTPNGGVLAPSSTTGGAIRLNFVGSDTPDGDVFNAAPPNSRSPWDGLAEENDPLAQYNSVSGGQTATYDFATDQRTFGLMWGSPDDYNTLSFFLGGVLKFELTGDQVDNPPAAGTGFVNVLISGLRFDQAVFASGTDAFEFAQVTASQVPLPAAIWLMLGGLGGLGFMSRKRARAAA